MTDYTDISISWHGDLTSISGNAQHARALLKPLLEGGANVQAFPIDSKRPKANLDKWWLNTIQKCTQSPPGLVMINHGPPSFDKQNPTGGPTILLTHWETQKAPKTWEPLMNSDKFSQIWVPNESCLSGSLSVKKPFKVVRYPLDFRRLDSVPRTSIVGVDEHAFIFGATGIWNNRKNLSDLIVAYYGEFSSIDRVALLIKTNGQNPDDPNERAKLVNLIKEIKKGFNKPDLPPVILLQDIFGYEAMDGIIKRFDCFVSTSRGEGKNLSMMKCMAVGTPCIFLSNHANEDLGKCDSNLLRRVRHVYEPVMQMGNYYSALDRWARPDLGDMMDSMRQVYNDHFSRKLDTDGKARKFLEDNYSYSVVTPKLAQYIRELMPFKVQDLVTT